VINTCSSQQDQFVTRCKIPSYYPSLFGTPTQNRPVWLLLADLRRLVNVRHLRQYKLTSYRQNIESSFAYSRILCPSDFPKLAEKDSFPGYLNTLCSGTL